MRSYGPLSPALFWRAFFFGVATATSISAAPPPKPPEGLAQVGKLDPVESRRVLEQFRRAGIDGEYYLEFTLHQLPRRGVERVFPGQLWGGRNARGSIVRIALRDGDGQERRLLVQNGDEPAVWTFANGKISPSGMAALLAPLVPGVELTAFDLEMPFVAWPDVADTAIVRVLGRPAHAFFFRPPAEFAAAHPEVAAVRGFFDVQFNVPTQTEILDASGKATKTLSLVELKRLGGQTIPKVLEVRNELSRDKTRLVVTAAALQLNLASKIFDPAALADEIKPPAADRLVPILP